MPDNLPMVAKTMPENTLLSISGSVKPLADLADSVQQTSKAIASFAEPSRLAVQAIAQMHEPIQALANELAQQLRESMVAFSRITFNIGQLQLTPPGTVYKGNPLIVEPKTVHVESSLIEVAFDQYGYILLNGHKIDRANATSSRHGGLLRLFEGRKGEIISDAEIKDKLKVLNPKQVLKDLKATLRLLGYELKITPLPRQGHVYDGIIKKQ